MTEEEKQELQDSVREVLKLLGDVSEIEQRVSVLKKKLEKIYEQIDDKLNGY